jgi:hypothetical protein
VKLFVDEDAGAGLGRALRAVGVEADWVGSNRSIRPGTRDEIWIPRAGREELLVLSRNLGILTVEAQHALVLEHAVGIVFLPQHLAPLPLLRLVLRRWDQLEAIYDTEPRPFAYLLTAAGRFRRLPL